MRRADVHLLITQLNTLFVMLYNFRSLPIFNHILGDRLAYSLRKTSKYVNHRCALHYEYAL